MRQGAGAAGRVAQAVNRQQTRQRLLAEEGLDQLLILRAREAARAVHERAALAEQPEAAAEELQLQRLRPPRDDARRAFSRVRQL